MLNIKKIEFKFGAGLLVGGRVSVHYLGPTSDPGANRVAKAIERYKLIKLLSEL